MVLGKEKVREFFWDEGLKEKLVKKEVVYSRESAEGSETFPVSTERLE